jgi:hypothetical protein
MFSDCFMIYLQISEKIEPTSGLEPLSCSLRVSSYAFTAVSRGFRKRSRKSYLPVMRFWKFADVRSGYCHGYCQSSVGNEIR